MSMRQMHIKPHHYISLQWLINATSTKTGPSTIVWVISQFYLCIFPATLHSLTECDETGLIEKNYFSLTIGYAELLVNHGANCKAKDRFGKTPWDLAFWPNCKLLNKIPNHNDVQFVSISKRLLYFCSERVFAQQNGLEWSIWRWTIILLFPHFPIWLAKIKRFVALGFIKWFLFSWELHPHHSLQQFVHFRSRVQAFFEFLKSHLKAQWTLFRCHLIEGYIYFLQLVNDITTQWRQSF